MKADRDTYQRDLTGAAMREAGLTMQEVWLRYFSMTGALDEYELDAYINKLIDLPVSERDLIAGAVNELIDELPPHRRAPYSDDPGPQPPS